MGDRLNSSKKRKGKSNESGSSSAFSMPLTERQQLAYLLSMTAKENKGDDSCEDTLESRKMKKAKLSPVSSINRPRNKNGETQLHICTMKGELEVIKDLVRQGADVNCRDNASWTPLHEACNHGHYKIAKFLLKSGSDVNAAGLDGDTSLHDASSNGHLKTVLLLLRHGADRHQKNDHGESPLDIAEGDKVIEALQNFSKEMLKDLKPKKDYTTEKHRYKDDDDVSKKIKSSSKSHKKTISNIDDFLETNSPVEVPKEKPISTKSVLESSSSLDKNNFKSKTYADYSSHLTYMDGNSELKDKASADSRYLDVSKKTKVLSGNKTLKTKEGLSEKSGIRKSIDNEFKLSLNAERKRHHSESSMSSKKNKEGLQRNESKYEKHVDKKVDDSDDDMTLSAFAGKEYKNESQHYSHPKKIRKHSLSLDSETKDKYSSKDEKDYDRKLCEYLKYNQKKKEIDSKEGTPSTKKLDPTKCQSIERSKMNTMQASSFMKIMKDNFGSNERKLEKNFNKKQTDPRMKSSLDSNNRTVFTAESQNQRKKINMTEQGYKPIIPEIHDKVAMTENKHVSIAKKIDDGLSRKDVKSDRSIEKQSAHRERKSSGGNCTEVVSKELQSGYQLKKVKGGLINEYKVATSLSGDNAMKSTSSNDGYSTGLLTSNQKIEKSPIKSIDNEGSISSEMERSIIDVIENSHSKKIESKISSFEVKSELNRSKIAVEHSSSSLFEDDDDENVIKDSQNNLQGKKIKSGDIKLEKSLNKKQDYSQKVKKTFDIPTKSSSEINVNRSKSSSDASFLMNQNNEKNINKKKDESRSADDLFQPEKKIITYSKLDKSIREHERKLQSGNQELAKLKPKSKHKISMKQFLLKSEELGSDTQPKNANALNEDDVSLKVYKECQLKLKKERLANKEKSKKDAHFYDSTEPKTETTKNKTNHTKYKIFLDDSDDDDKNKYNLYTQHMGLAVHKTVESEMIVSGNVIGEKKEFLTIDRNEDNKYNVSTGVKKEITESYHRQTGNSISLSIHGFEETLTSNKDKSEKLKSPHVKMKGNSIEVSHKKKATTKEKLNRMHQNESNTYRSTDENLSFKQNETNDKISPMDMEIMLAGHQGDSHLDDSSNVIKVGCNNVAHLDRTKLSPSTTKDFVDKKTISIIEKGDHCTKAATVLHRSSHTSQTKSVEKTADLEKNTVFSDGSEKFNNQTMKHIPIGKTKSVDIILNDNRSTLNASQRAEEKRIRKERKQKLKRSLNSHESSDHTKKHIELSKDKERKHDFEDIHKYAVRDDNDDQSTLSKDLLKSAFNKDDENKKEKITKTKVREYFQDSKGINVNYPDLGYQEVDILSLKGDNVTHISSIPKVKSEDTNQESKFTSKVKNMKGCQENHPQFHDIFQEMVSLSKHKSKEYSQDSKSHLKSKDMNLENETGTSMKSGKIGQSILSPLKLKSKDSQNNQENNFKTPDLKEKSIDALKTVADTKLKKTAIDSKNTPKMKDSKTIASPKLKSKEYDEGTPNKHKDLDSNQENNTKTLEVKDKYIEDLQSVSELKSTPAKSKESEESEGIYGPMLKEECQSYKDSTSRSAELTSSQGKDSNAIAKLKKSLHTSASVPKQKSKEQISDLKDPPLKHKDSCLNQESYLEIPMKVELVKKDIFSMNSKEYSHEVKLNLDANKSLNNSKEAVFENLRKDETGLMSDFVSKSKECNKDPPTCEFIRDNQNVNSKLMSESVFPTDKVVSVSPEVMELSKLTFSKVLEDEFDKSHVDVIDEFLGITEGLICHQKPKDFVVNLNTSDGHEEDLEMKDLSSVLSGSKSQSPMSSIRKDILFPQKSSLSMNVTVLVKRLNESKADPKHSSINQQITLSNDKSRKDLESNESIILTEKFDADDKVIEEHIFTCGPKLDKSKHKVYNIVKREHSDVSNETFRKKHKRKHSDEGSNILYPVKTKKSRSLDSDPQENKGSNLPTPSKEVKIFPSTDVLNLSYDSKMLIEAKKRHKHSKSSDGIESKYKISNVSAENVNSNEVSPIKNQDLDHISPKLGKHISNKDDKKTKSFELPISANTSPIKIEFKAGVRAINVKDSDILHKAAKLKEVDLNMKVGLNDTALELVKKKKRKRYSESRESTSDLRVLKVPTELISIEKIPSPTMTKKSEHILSNEMQLSEISNEMKLSKASCNETKLPENLSQETKLQQNSKFEAKFPDTSTETKLPEIFSTETNLLEYSSAEMKLPVMSVKAKLSQATSNETNLPNTSSVELKLLQDSSNEAKLLISSNDTELPNNSLFEVKLSENRSNETLADISPNEVKLPVTPSNKIELLNSVSVGTSETFLGEEAKVIEERDIMNQLIYIVEKDAINSCKENLHYPKKEDMLTHTPGLAVDREELRDTESKTDQKLASDITEKEIKYKFEGGGKDPFSNNLNEISITKITEELQNISPTYVTPVIEANDHIEILNEDVLFVADIQKKESLFIKTPVYDKNTDLQSNHINEMARFEQQLGDNERDEENENAVVNLLNMDREIDSVDEEDNVEQVQSSSLILNSSSYIQKDIDDKGDNFIDENTDGIEDDSSQGSACSALIDFNNKTDAENLSNIFDELNKSVTQNQLSEQIAPGHENLNIYDDSKMSVSISSSTNIVTLVTPVSKVASCDTPSPLKTNTSDIICPSMTIDEYCPQNIENINIDPVNVIAKTAIETSVNNNNDINSSIPYNSGQKGTEIKNLNEEMTTIDGNTDLTLKNDEFSELMLPSTLTTVASFGQRYNDLDSIDTSDLLKPEKVSCTNDILSSSSDSIILKKDLIDGQLGFSTNLSSDEIISKFADCILELDDTDNTYSLREYIPPPLDSSGGHQEKQFVSTISSVVSSINLDNQSNNIHNIADNESDVNINSSEYFHSSDSIYMPSVPASIFNDVSAPINDINLATCISQPLYVSTVTTRLSTSDEKHYSPKHIFARGKIYSPKATISSSNSGVQNRRVSIEPCDMLRSLIESDIPVVPDAPLSSLPTIPETEKEENEHVQESVKIENETESISETEVMVSKTEKPNSIIPGLCNWREVIHTRCSRISHIANARDLDMSLANVIREPKYKEVIKKAKTYNLPQDMLMRHASEKEKLRIHMVQEWCRTEQSIDLLSKERGPISGISILYYQKDQISRKLGSTLDFKSKTTIKPDYQKLRDARLADLQDKFERMQHELEKHQQLEIEGHQKYEELYTIFNQKEMLRHRYLRLRNKINL